MNLLLLLSFFLLSHISKIFCFAVDYYDYIVIIHSLIVHICSHLCMGGNGSAFAECRRLIEVHAYLKRKRCMCIMYRTLYNIYIVVYTCTLSTWYLFIACHRNYCGKREILHKSWYVQVDTKGDAQKVPWTRWVWP